MMNDSKYKANLFIVSPPKTGTSSLFAMLSEHFRICPCSIKEPHFFSNRYDRYEEGWYDSIYPTRQPDWEEDCRYYMESSTTYFYSRWGFARIKKDCSKDSKFICVLRDPVERFVSHYKHFRATNKIANDEVKLKKFLSEITDSKWKEEFIQTLNKWKGWPRPFKNSRQSLKDRRLRNGMVAGHYKTNLERMYKYIDSKNVLVIPYSAYRKNYISTLDKICDFLSIERFLPPHRANYNTSASWEQFVNLDDEITDSMIADLTEYYDKVNEGLDFEY